LAFIHIGYARLIDTYQLRARPLAVTAVIDTAKGPRQVVQGGAEFARFEPKYEPEHTLVGDLQFALRYEGINLELLALLFAKTGAAELNAWLQRHPESAFARRAGYLFEWLTSSRLKVSVPAKAAYVRVLDKKLQFGASEGARDTKFRVIDNLPGTHRFCPLVRRTAFLDEMAQKDLKRRTEETLARYDRDLLRRAAAFLYLKETHSSFEVEREKPSADRAQRFADLLREAETVASLSEDRFVQLQNAVVDARFREPSYRHKQNWVGLDLDYRKKVDFVPPRPEDVSDLMEGLVALAEIFRANPQGIDPVVMAGALSFGFVFIHPFIDGNGRLHRYLIHETLARAGFTPKGIVLPVSAVILANLDRYKETLEHFSAPLLALTTYNADVPDVPATGNDAVYFRYFDATDQVSFLYWALERTVEHDLAAEIDFLLGFDVARARLNVLLDWPGQSLDLFIQVVHQNNGHLSKAKRQAHFDWMTDNEVSRCEAIVEEAFAQARPLISG
jgi:hypothetical protein